MDDGRRHVKQPSMVDGGGHCLLCHAPLQYHTHPVGGKCTCCGDEGQWYVSCPDGHLVCESCHNMQSLEQIKTLMLQSRSIDPLAIADACMALDAVPMLGCQHAYIACGALMVSLINRDVFSLTDAAVHEVFQRTEKQAHGGFCGLTGVCGIAPALGACIAVLNGSKCGSNRAQRQTMELVARVVRAITDITGPSCCKAYVRVALAVAVQFLSDEFSLEFPQVQQHRCQDMARHPHGCRGADCPYGA